MLREASLAAGGYLLKRVADNCLSDRRDSKCLPWIMTFSRQILAGLAGESSPGFSSGAGGRPVVGRDGFVKLLQMMVLPYITVSIIASWVSKPSSSAHWPAAAAVIGGLWFLALSFAFLIPDVPEGQSASFFSSSLVERPPHSTL